MTKESFSAQRKALLSGETTMRQIVEGYLDAIRAGADWNAYITVMEEEALAEADALDRKIAAGEPLGALAGAVLAVKDNLSTAGKLTTCASKMLSNYRPIYNATVVQRAIDADAIIIGKTNMDEFAMGATTETSYYGPTKNPVQPAHVPGGSSGGSAAAVAGGLASLALGTDTGGSIRQPAAYCGIYGMKPTYGRVSRHGCVAFASSLDQIGPMANCLEDLAVLLQVIAGHDAKDATAIDAPVPAYSEALAKGVQGLSVGIPEELMTEQVALPIREAIEKAAEALRVAGATVERVHLPNIEQSIPTYYLIATAEASSNLARYDGVRYGVRAHADDVISMFKKTRAEGFGDEVKRRIMLGTYALSAGYYDAYYLKALKVRRLIQEAFLKALETHDVILAPTTIMTAPKLGEKMDAVQAYAQDICTCPVNLAGLPAMSLPFGAAEGLPIGLQLIGPGLGEALLFQVAAVLDQHAKEATHGV